MLIKRVSPVDSDLTKEVKYMLTADIQEMAQLVGIHPERLRSILCYSTDATKPTYGVARPSTFFTAACNAKRPRALSLSQVDIRAQDGFRLDASGSFVIIPIYVMRPSFVGNLESTNGLRYELIPNLRARVPNMGDQMFYQYANLEQPFRDFARELENSEGFEINHDLMGWDLVLLSEEPVTPEPSPSEEPRLMPLVRAMKAMHENHNVIYDYGFGVSCEYVCTYTEDNTDCLNIDHNVYYKGRVMFHRESAGILTPGDVLQQAMKYLNLNSKKETEAYEVMRAIRHASHYPGIGYRRS